MPLSVSFPSKGGAHPFQEQLDFFRAKLALTSERYDDILKSAHDRGFIVAGAAVADLVNDLHQAIAQAITEGAGLEAFRQQFAGIVQKHGWTGWTGEGTAAGQAWRTRVIYQTNMTTSYAAGRWKQLTHHDLLSTRPYWQYVHSDSVMHPRPLHVSWNGLVLPHDHPFWLTHFPPNGWGCQCRVVAVSAKTYAKAQEDGRAAPPEDWQQIDPKTGAPRGIDQGWDYAPGANATRPLQEFIDRKLIKLDAPIGAAMYQQLAPRLREERNDAWSAYLGQVLADPVKRGRTAIVGAIDPATIAWLRDALEVSPASAEIAIQDSLIVGKKAVRHGQAGDAFSAEEWAALPDRLENPERIVFDTRTGKLLYIVGSDESRLGKLAVEFDFKAKHQAGMLNMIVSAFKVAPNTITEAIQSGLLKVIK